MLIYLSIENIKVLLEISILKFSKFLFFPKIEKISATF